MYYSLHANRYFNYIFRWRSLLKLTINFPEKLSLIQSYIFHRSMYQFIAKTRNKKISIFTDNYETSLIRKKI